MNPKRLAFACIALALALSLAPFAFARGKPEDLIKTRQGTFRVIGWHCSRLKANIDGPFNKEEILASAAIIQSVASAGFAPFFGPGTEKGVGFHESRAKPEAFTSNNAKKLADIAGTLAKDAGELAKIAAGGDKSAIKAQFANLTRSCNSCHDEFRVKP